MSNKCLIDYVGPIELHVSRWPLILYVAAGVLVASAVFASGLSGWGKCFAVSILFAIGWREWRGASILKTVRFSPVLIEGVYADGETFSLEPPYQCLVQPGFISLKVNRHWQSIFADQMDADSFRRLRRVLWLHRH